MNELYHHGIKGQKWGVRRFQNHDGTLTKEGKTRLKYRTRTVNANKTSKDVDDIISTMTKDEKNKLYLDDDGTYLNFEQGSSVAKRIIKKNENVPVAWFDMLEDGSNLNIALGTRSGDEFRGKGHASYCAKKGMEWFNRQKEYDTAIWGVRVDNIGSIKIAEKNGFVLDNNSYSDDKKWVNYVYKKNNTQKQ